jgi:hypothetical protein
LSTNVLLPIVVFFALGLPIVVLLWRIFVVGGQLRREVQHGRTALDIARRADVSLTELAEVVDELRRRKAGPEASEASMRACADALRHYALEAEAVDKQIGDRDGPGLKPEIERAQRAVELIEHGRALMASSPHEHGPEAETSVKRGYVNLLHARDAIQARGQEIADAAQAARTEARQGHRRNRQ